MRRLKAPTLQQWGCAHQWHVTHTRSGWPEPWPKLRYMRCGRCGLRVKSEEELAVPWSEQDMVAQIRQLLPEGRAVEFRRHGITTLPLAGLNRILEKHRLVIHASKGDDPTQMVACVNDYGKVEQYGLFKLRRLSQMATGRRKRGG
jgi:hypothetical protein